MGREEVYEVSIDVDVSGYKDIFEAFTRTSGFKKILSFGGWAFSTSPATFPIFRQGVTPAQRQTFADNVVSFINQHDLDGVDFDWEYPGAPDIPGITPGSPEDGPNYLHFLQLVRKALPSDKTVSIAAPASYWYLKGFPIAKISQTVDYIIYMTYDLHGQWDYGNDFTDPGCPAGNCLRSQINHTETKLAFSMITKAGAPINKLMLGQPLYGRSFEMTDPSCYTDMCTFTGPASGAMPGECTDTAGYISNWEIEQVISNSSNSVQQYSSEVAGDILVYDSNWVSWMKPSTYDSRSSWAQSLGFGGTSDWAMDLNASYADNGSSLGEGSGVVYISPNIYNETDPTVACSPPCTFVLPPWTLSSASTISPSPTTMTVEELWPVTSSVGQTVTTVYMSKTAVTTITIPPVTTRTIDVWNVEWTDTKVETILLTSSIILPAVTLTEPSDTVTETGRSSTTTTTVAGIVYSYKPGPYPPQTGPKNGQQSTVTPGPPPPGFPGSIHVTVGPPHPTCFPPGVDGCGTLCKENCEPELPCVGICDCIGIGCPDGGGCIGPGCNGNDDSSESSSSTSCESSTTVTDCERECIVTNSPGGSSFTTGCTQLCSTTVGCDLTATTSSTTTTHSCPSIPAYTPWYSNGNQQAAMLGDGRHGGVIYTTGTWTSNDGSSDTGQSFVSCSTQNPDPDGGITAGYCVCSGSTFAQSTDASVSPVNVCAYTDPLPASTTAISTLPTTATTTKAQPSSSASPPASTSSSDPIPGHHVGTRSLDNAGDEPNGLCAYNDSNGDLQVVPCGPSDTDEPFNCRKSGDSCAYQDGSDAADCYDTY